MSGPADYPGMKLLLEGAKARSTEQPVRLDFPGAGIVEVIDSICENGPKLVRASPEVAFVAPTLGMRLVPIIQYQVAANAGLTAPSQAGRGPPLKVSVICKSTKKPVAGARVIVITSFPEGAEAMTNAAGECQIDLGPLPSVLGELHVDPPSRGGYWGRYERDVACTINFTVEVEPLRPTDTDVLAHFYGHRARRTAGKGVTIGIVDTGIDNTHIALRHVTEGENTVTGELSSEWQDNGTGHGTHVAGIIGGRGRSRTGLAPGAKLISFRAFPQGSHESTNYQILKALMRAMDGGCDIINLSLSGEERPDEVMREAFEEAKGRGILTVVAAGNQAKCQVGYPALYAFSEGLSVSAMGRKGTFPKGANEDMFSNGKMGVDPSNFVAAFSNTGDVSLIAPGVGIISTLPGGSYGVMTGTSQACPAVTGMAARILAADLQANPKTGVLRHALNSDRTVAMIKLVSAAATKLFNDVKVEGEGMIC